MAILPSLGLTVVQMHSHLPAAIPEQALHWWCPDPAVEATLGDGPGSDGGDDDEDDDEDDDDDNDDDYDEDEYPRPLYCRMNLTIPVLDSHHSRARSIIERAFGMMKTRFRSIFLKALEAPHLRSSTCAVMHNICIGAGDIMAPDADIVEDAGRMCWRQSVVPLGGTNCVQRCLPWRRFPWTPIYIRYYGKQSVHPLPILLGSPLLCLSLVPHILFYEIH
ncbi:hypothetical protein F7725_026990 [Dissostichus mawsoni]|uniref:DDE Tnp4 domain-containing protein n=1 Tax=Dissostichus mawsoni TaxID=36200 RepID=A0A7J5X8L6_DISMA|nr:hypothetical protein F7725_026990 [Dissostichus mawsoni]